ncbi:MAG: YlqD family protein [Mycobacterium leprae]
MSIQILRPVTLKAKVTDSLKVRLTAEMQEAVKLLDDEMKELESQVQRAQLTATINPQQQMQLRQLVERERAQRADKKAQLQEEMKVVQNLPLGTEIVQGQAQSIATIDVGSEFDTTVDVEVVIEDGKVVEIRRG